jgi:hypothetical protein
MNPQLYVDGQYIGYAKIGTPFIKLVTDALANAGFNVVDV